MAWRERLIETLEARTGFTLAPRETMARLVESAEHFREFTNEASELAYWTLDYFGGRPQEMQAEARKRLAQRSRIAFIHDPIAGAEADLLANFAFAGGIGRPDANDPQVQPIIDRAWNDPNNEAMFTGYAAQRRSSNTLLTQGELMDTLYVRGGRIRVGKLDPDMVTDIVPDPEFRLRPLYYLGLRRKFRWNVEMDRPDFDMDQWEGGQPKRTYYAHWRNLDDAKRERETEFGSTLEPLPVIPAEKQDPGGAVVYHTAINQLDEQLRGNPPWARTIRFYSAMNEFTEARVSMAQAASTFIARRSMGGGTQSELVRSAGAVLSQTGELGTQRFTESRFGTPNDVSPGVGQVPGGPFAHTAAAGSWWVENDRSKLESLSLNSGAAAAAQDAQIIRAPLSAASGFGQHYLGDASHSNLATATSLELPTLMVVLAWQKVFGERFKWFTERAIEAAVHAGELGGVLPDDQIVTDGRKLTELRLVEGSADAVEMGKRTGIDLGFSFSMPYPGRRNLPDVTGSVVNVLGVGDGILVENEAFMEQALLFLFTHGWQTDDPQAGVGQVMEKMKAQIEERKKIAQQIAATGAAGIGNPKPDLSGGPSSVAGHPAGSTPPKNEMGAVRHGALEEAWLPPDLRAPVDEFATSTAELFARLVELPAVVAATALGPSRNGTPEPIGA